MILEQIIRRSRFVTIVEEAKGFTIETNLWQNQEQLDPYTICVRAWGVSLESASRKLAKKLELLDIKFDIME